MVIQAMNQMHCVTLLQLQEKVLRTSKDFDYLLQVLTVSVSEMFRNPSYFLAIREKVVPFLKTYPSLKVWIAGCCTGEEVYSMAILFQEEGLLDRTLMYATDINEKSLAKAKVGAFLLKDIEKYSQSYEKSGGRKKLSDYYSLSGNTVVFHRSLIQNVTFAEHSLVTDSVFSENQFISCRNVVMYFNRALQDRAFELFRESLCRKGFLGLGNHETLQFSELEIAFSALDKADRIFQKN